MGARPRESPARECAWTIFAHVRFCGRGEGGGEGRGRGKENVRGRDRTRRGRINGAREEWVQAFEFPPFKRSGCDAKSLMRELELLTSCKADFE